MNATVQREQLVAKIRTFDQIKSELIKVKKGDHLSDCTNSQDADTCTCGKFEAEEICHEIGL